MTCKLDKRCGGCTKINEPYEKQLACKQKYIDDLLKPFGKPLPIIGMTTPYYYRNKVHHVVMRDKAGEYTSGIYEENSHKIVPVKECLIEDKISQDIIADICSMMKSFKIYAYDEDRGTGFLRHILVRRGFKTGEVMVVLVVASSVFPSKNNFVKALLLKHPEITTIVLNVNNKRTSMVLGDKSEAIYGKGYIHDELCGLKFRISPSSFYQINPVQTEKLYKTAIDFAEFSGNETIIDAYCGIGTIGLACAGNVKKVIGVELNKNAVRDACENKKLNGIKNADFYPGDAGDFMVEAAGTLKIDVVMMDPPRSGSTTKFIDAIAKLRPKKVVYVSCGPDTLARDLGYFKKKGYVVKKIQPVDMFPNTDHVETCVLLVREGAHDDNRNRTINLKTI